jgi:hypothetical protein
MFLQFLTQLQFGLSGKVTKCYYDVSKMEFIQNRDIAMIVNAAPFALVILASRAQNILGCSHA